MFISGMLIEVYNKLPLNKVVLPSPTLFDIAIYYIVVLLLLQIIKLHYVKKSFYKAIIIYIIIASIIGAFSSANREEVLIEFIDVGQGDCILIRDGDINFLIDTGGTPLSDYDIGKNILLPYLQKSGVNRLDGIFVSHFHEDHSEGLLSILDDIRIDNVFIGYKKEDSQLYTRTIEELNKRKIQVSLLTKKDRISWSKNAYIEVINPSDYIMKKYTQEENNLSLVLLFNAYGKRVLFTGDIEEDVEEDLIRENGELKIDILKVAHHGSKTSTTENFIKLLKPSHAVIQVGKNNFGHPNEDVLKRLFKKDIKVFRTDKEGLVTAKISAHKLEISTYMGTRSDLDGIIVKYRWILSTLILDLIVILFTIRTYKKYSYHSILITNDYNN